MQLRHAHFEAEHRNAAVLAVLESRPFYMFCPAEIAKAIAEPWCCDGRWGKSSAITPVLRRIGAVRHAGGRYTAPTAAPKNLIPVKAEG